MTAFEWNYGILPSHPTSWSLSECQRLDARSPALPKLPILLTAERLPSPKSLSHRYRLPTWPGHPLLATSVPLNHTSSPFSSRRWGFCGSCSDWGSTDRSWWLRDSCTTPGGTIFGGSTSGHTTIWQAQPHRSTRCREGCGKIQEIPILLLFTLLPNI